MRPFFIEFNPFYQNRKVVEARYGFEAISIAERLNLTKTNYLREFKHGWFNVVVQLSEEEARYFHGKSVKTIEGEVNKKIDFTSKNYCKVYNCESITWDSLQPEEVEEIWEDCQDENGCPIKKLKEYKFTFDWRRRWIIEEEKKDN